VTFVPTAAPEAARRHAADAPRRWRVPGPECLAWPFIAFLAGFFLIPDSKWHNNLFYAAVLLPALALLRPAHLAALGRTPLACLAAALLAYLWLSGLWSVPFDAGAWLHEGRRLVALLAFLAVSTLAAVAAPQQVRRGMRLVLLAAAVGAVVSLAAFYGEHRLSQRLEYAGRLYNPNVGAAAFGFAALVAWYGCVRAPKPWPVRLWWIGITAVLVLAVAAAQSRTALIALVLLLTAGMGRHARLAVMAGVLAGGGLLAWQAARGHDPLALAERGLAYRPQIWAVTLDHIAERPWFGHGQLAPGEIHLPEARFPNLEVRDFEHPHSAYLATAYYGGIVGAALLAALLAAAARAAWRHRAAAGGAWSAGFAYAAVCLITDGNRLLDSPHALWLYGWWPLALLAAEELRAGWALLPARARRTPMPARYSTSRERPATLPAPRSPYPRLP
jgi:O-antigen ligase